MSRLTINALAGAMLLLVAAPVAQASEDLKAVVMPFYTQMLTVGGDVPATASKVLAEDWVSVGKPGQEKGPGREGFVKTLGAFHGAIPDLKWEIKEVLVAGNRVVVRGEASGTPVKPFAGMQASGKAFRIQSIDIHTVENGKIIRSYHVEDWASASQQTAAK